MGTALRRRLNITLAKPTLRFLDRLSGKGNCSQRVDQAVRFHVGVKMRRNLRWQFREGAECRAERDRGLAEDWFRLDDGR